MLEAVSDWWLIMTTLGADPGNNWRFGVIKIPEEAESRGREDNRCLFARNKIQKVVAMKRILNFSEYVV